MKLDKHEIRKCIDDINSLKRHRKGINTKYDEKDDDYYINRLKELKPIYENLISIIKALNYVLNGYNKLNKPSDRLKYPNKKFYEVFKYTKKIELPNDRALLLIIGDREDIPAKLNIRLCKELELSNNSQVPDSRYKSFGVISDWFIYKDTISKVIFVDGSLNSFYIKSQIDILMSKALRDISLNEEGNDTALILIKYISEFRNCTGTDISEIEKYGIHKGDSRKEEDPYKDKVAETNYKSSLDKIDEIIDETLSNCDLENIRPDEVLDIVNSKVKIPKASEKVSHKWYDDSCYSSSYDSINLLMALVIDLSLILLACSILMEISKCQCSSEILYYFCVALVIVSMTVFTAWAINLILLLVVKRLRGED